MRIFKAASQCARSFVVASVCSVLMVGPHVNVAMAYQYPPSSSVMKSRIFIAPRSLNSVTSTGVIATSSSNLRIQKLTTVSAGVISVSPSGPTLLGYGSNFPSYLMTFQSTDTSNSQVAIPTAESMLTTQAYCANIASVSTPSTFITSGPLNVGSYLVSCAGPATVSVTDDSLQEIFLYTVQYPAISLVITPTGHTPTFGTATPTADGFTLLITNWDPYFTWTGTDSAGGQVNFSSGTIVVTGLAPGTSSTVTVTTTQTGYTTAGATSSAISSVTGAALNPTFGTPTPTADGFTVQISNYSANYTWAGTATASGSVAISGTGLVTVTGVAPGTSSTATITTTRTGYGGGSNTVSATSTTGAALNPTFGTPTPTADGFTVQISNYSANYSWAGTATASGSVAISDTGFVTVTGVAPGTSSTATITTTRTSYAGGSNTVSATSTTGAALNPTFGTPTPTADGFILQITNWDNAFIWDGTDSVSGAVTMISPSGLITVTGLPRSRSSIVTVTTTRTGYFPGSASAPAVITLSPLALTPPSAPTTYTVHFDIQGHGRPIADLTGVITAVLPSESADGYFTFSGWSTTRTGTPLSGSYTPSANSTLYALWADHTPVTPTPTPTPTETPQNPGGQVAEPIILPKTPVVKRAVPVKFSQRAVPFLSVALFTKFADITSHTKEVAIPHDAGAIIKLTAGVAQSLSNELQLVITKTGVKFTAVKGWTGRIAVPVVSTVNKKLVESFVGVEEDPASVVHPTFVLLDTHRAKVSWSASASQVLEYNLYLGSKLVCTTNHTSCVLSINSITNFVHNLQIESVGHQSTYSIKVLPTYLQNTLISAGNVHFDNNSQVLSSSEILNLDSVIVTLRELGVTQVTINGHADSAGGTNNQKLSIARARAVEIYMAKKLPQLKIAIHGFSSKVPISSNANSSGRSNNRRAEILVG